MLSGADELRILSRRSKVAELVLRGVTNQYEICRQLGMDEKQRSTISRDIAAINKDWREEAARVLDEHKGKELARLALVEAAAWKGWERSLENAETLEAIKSGDRETAKKTSRGQAGDPTFLRIVLDCVTQRRALLGLDAPKRAEVTGKDGGDIRLSIDGLLAQARDKVESLRREILGPHANGT